MVFGNRWRTVTWAGCLLLLVGTVWAAARGQDFDLLASRIDVVESEMPEDLPPVEPLCSHGPCPTGFASFFSGRHGVLSKYPNDSFVHIVFEGQ
jgi:hypothetical protein